MLQPVSVWILFVSANFIKSENSLHFGLLWMPGRLTSIGQISHQARWKRVPCMFLIRTLYQCKECSIVKHTTSSKHKRFVTQKQGSDIFTRCKTAKLWYECPWLWEHSCSKCSCEMRRQAASQTSGVIKFPPYNPSHWNTSQASCTRHNVNDLTCSCNS